MASNRLDGRTALVTGATQGIGAAIARRLHGEGAHVVIVARSIDAQHPVLAELGERVGYVRGDVADRATAIAAVALAMESGRLDILINNAGIDLNRDLLDTDESAARAMFETNVFGALWMLQEAGAVMALAGRGSIINITSRTASVGVPGMSVYGASKGALLALTRGAAIELAASGVRVNAVAPGFTETAMLTSWSDAMNDPEAQLAAVRSRIPQGRFGTESEVAALCAFLAADESAHITGASIAIDGGYTAA